MNKKSITKLQSFKNEKPITMITAYDALFASLFDTNVDMILVGDSLNMSFLGKDDTLSATLDQMIYHTQAVCNGAPNTFVICDMPFGSYLTNDQALESSVRVYKETKADAVKIEGGKEKAPMIQHLTTNGIAVIGHIGLMPQMVRSEGGYSVKGKDEVSKAKILEDAKAVESAGACILVIEGVKSDIAQLVAQTLKIPVVGIGAGKEVDGQVLVWSDMLGFFEAFKPKFVKHYLNGATQVKEAVQQYVDEVESKAFPDSDHCY